METNETKKDRYLLIVSGVNGDTIAHEYEFEHPTRMRLQTFSNQIIIETFDKCTKSETVAVFDDSRTVIKIK